LKLVGPVLGRFQPEFLGVIANRIFGILLRAGKFPPIPQAVLDFLENSDISLRIKYVSPIAKAQKLYVAQSIQQGIMTIGGTAQIKPEVLDKVDFDKIVDMVSDYYNVPLLPQDQVDAVRQARAEEIAEVKAQQEAALTAQVAKDASKVKTDEGIFAQ
jgi:hypothetical protein